ncbi:MAG: arginyltransferase [Maioricimonas sp. JB049]
MCPEKRLQKAYRPTGASATLDDMSRDSILPPSLLQLRTPPRRCSYLPDETASLEYRFYHHLTASQLEALLMRGWRRHGQHIFRPACPACVSCRSLRVDIERFTPTKSQRRALRRNADVEVLLQPATVSEEHLDLYNAWHADMHVRRGWPEQSMTREDYEEAFLSGRGSYACELLYRRNGKAIGVGLVDLTPNACSSVYFYHDPQWRSQAPGTYSVLQEIELCRQRRLQYLYMGYWIADCPSMAYKNRFGPHEILQAYCMDTERPEWRPVD